MMSLVPPPPVHRHNTIHSKSNTHVASKLWDDGCIWFFLLWPTRDKSNGTYCPSAWADHPPAYLYPPVYFGAYFLDPANMPVTLNTLSSGLVTDSTYGNTRSNATSLRGCSWLVTSQWPEPEMGMPNFDVSVGLR